MATKPLRRGAPILTDRDAARLVLATDLGFSTIRRAYAGDVVRPDRLCAIELAAIENNIAPPPPGDRPRTTPKTKTTTPTRGPGCAES